MIAPSPELEKYLSICPERDYLVMTGKVPATFDDYSRITFVLMKLDFFSLFVAFHKEHEKQYAFMETGEPTYILTAKAQKWLEDFLDNLPEDLRPEYEFILD